MKQFSQPIKFYITVSGFLLAESFSSITFDSTLPPLERILKEFYCLQKYVTLIMTH